MLLFSDTLIKLCTSLLLSHCHCPSALIRQQKDVLSSLHKRNLITNYLYISSPSVSSPVLCPFPSLPFCFLHTCMSLVSTLLLWGLLYCSLNT